MRYRILGQGGLRVSELCLGTMTFGEEWGFGSSPEESKTVFEAFVEAGGNFIDTANSYTGGSSERILGTFLGRDRDRFVLATKYSHSEQAGDPNAGGNHAKSLRRAVEASLSRLGTDYLDVLWLHAWDGTTPVDVLMRGLDDLVRSGKVLHLGVSDTPAWIIARANARAESRGWSPFIAVQLEYNLVQRTAERDLIPMARTLGLPVVAWGPLAAGLLTGKYLGDDVGGRLRTSAFYEGALTPEALRNSRHVARVAESVGATPAQVAIAWVRSSQEGILPIIGARTVAQLAELLGALDLDLDAGTLASLDGICPPALGFPHDFLRSGAVRTLLYSGMADVIDRTEVA